MSVRESLRSIFRGFVGDVLPEPLPRPLRPIDARGYALEAFADWVAGLEYPVIGSTKNPPPTIVIPRSNVFVEQPPDPIQLHSPAVSFVPVRGEHEPFRMTFLEATFGQFAPGAALFQFGEYLETFTVEVWGSHGPERTTIHAGIADAMRRGEWSQALLLQLPAYFGVVARFTLASEHIDDADVVRGRVRSHLYILLEVPEVQLLDAVTLKPAVAMTIADDPC